MGHSNNDLLPPTFNRLAWSNLAAQSAEQIALAAAPIVAVLLLGVGEGQTGLLQTALTLPFVLFAIPAGLLADRFSRRWLMTGAEALRALALLAILAALWFGGLSLSLLGLLGFAGGPALGGLLVGWIGAGPAFGFAAALSVIAAVLLARIVEPVRQAIARRHPWQEIKEGAAFVFRHDLL